MTRYAKSLREILGPEEALKWRQEAWEKGAEARKARREARKAAREAAARERDHQAWAKMQASWVRGSSRKQSVLLKVAVKEEFGLPQEVWKRASTSSPMNRLPRRARRFDGCMRRRRST